jgi:hypothetical protein
MAYLPGTEGGSAVADVLFGRVNPSGHLSVSWPSEATRNPPLSQFNPGAPSPPAAAPALTPHAWAGARSAARVGRSGGVAGRASGLGLRLGVERRP